jgi:hypothetical protein
MLIDVVIRQGDAVEAPGKREAGSAGACGPWRRSGPLSFRGEFRRLSGEGSFGDLAVTPAQLIRLREPG